MNQPAPRGLPAIAAYLRDLATRSRFHTRADHFHDIAIQLHQANRELQHLRASPRASEITSHPRGSSYFSHSTNNGGAPTTNPTSNSPPGPDHYPTWSAHQAPLREPPTRVETSIFRTRSRHRAFPRRRHGLRPELQLPFADSTPLRTPLDASRLSP